MELRINIVLLDARFRDVALMEYFFLGVGVLGHWRIVKWFGVSGI